MPISNTCIIILGASGDLTRRKLMPALAKLHAQQYIDSSCLIIGSARTEMTTNGFRAQCDWPQEFSQILHYHTGIAGLKHFIGSKGNFAHVIFFLALPPSAYEQTAAALAAEGFGKEIRLIIEKPFGYNYQSARGINAKLLIYFEEAQIYRIDHYLAKEAVQNILVFRYANSLFYPVWNANYIESIQINASEEQGIVDRGKYFDTAGIIRDMVQNHLFQLLALLTMEAPVTLSSEDIRIQKLNLLKAIEVISCTRYQYQGYLQERDIAAASRTETFAELKLHINNYRWNNMPVYIKVGKALNRTGTEIGFRFKNLPKLLFNKDGTVPANRIIFKIQPAEGIIVDISSKTPGNELRLMGTNLKFCFRDYFKDDVQDAYGKLLLDALQGDSTLFVSKEEVEIAWQKLDPFLDKGDLHYYAKGTLPATALDVDWIDFDAYKSACE